MNDLEANPALEATSVRFTIDGDDTLERHLESTCARVTSGIRGLIPGHKLEAVILGGGYGRGEGGVMRGAGGDRPYNDLEFYVAIRGNRHVNEWLYHRRLEVLSEILAHLAGIEIELKVTSLAELESKPVSMFTYDLAWGHRVLWTRGPADLEPVWTRHRREHSIPHSEAARLLMNRCTGLLLARGRLRQRDLTQESADFVRRNVAKAQLACGDALLAAHGQYHWSCRERHSRLAHLARRKHCTLFDDALSHHRDGVGFKLHPEIAETGRTDLENRHRAVSQLALNCWLWNESRRLGQDYPSLHAYLDDPRNKWEGSPTLRNVLLNLRANGIRALTSRSILRHPRGRAFHSMAILLWNEDFVTNVSARRRLSSELNVSTGSSSGWLHAYHDLWSHVR
jgi:hypothetical protein